MTKPFKFKLSGLWGRQPDSRVKRSSLAERRARFDAENQKGVDAAAEGRVKDADEVFDRLEAKYEAMSKRTK